MSQWPAELIRFLERPVPIYIHLAAAGHEASPFVCRGYGIRADRENGLVWVYIMHSQWLRLSECTQDQSWLAVLLTAGTDNESYQLKGRFIRHRIVTGDDSPCIDRQRKLTSDYFPHLLPLVSVTASHCDAVCMRVDNVYLQTPGPGAGALLSERSE